MYPLPIYSSRVCASPTTPTFWGTPANGPGYFTPPGYNFPAAASAAHATELAHVGLSLLGYHGYFENECAQVGPGVIENLLLLLQGIEPRLTELYYRHAHLFIDHDKFNSVSFQNQTFLSSHEAAAKVCEAYCADPARRRSIPSQEELEALHRRIEWEGLRTHGESSWWGERPLESPYEPEGEEQVKEPSERKPRMSVDAANDKAMELAKEHGEKFFFFSLTKITKMIGCHAKTFKKTQLFRRWKKRQPKINRSNSAPPRTIALTPALEGGLEEKGTNEALDALIEEQERDFDPSPLEEDEPGRPARVYRRR